MSDWLDLIWKDLTHYTILFPVEFTVTIFFILLSQLPKFRGTWFGGIYHRFQNFSNHRQRAVFAVLAVTLLVHILLNPTGFDVPAGTHDEFSYLLAADTFASGRITNAPHPMKLFFQSFHILVEPTYMSMYAPAQGLMLALGKVLTGKPLLGVWLSAALASSAICWMLQGWTRPTWAFTGGLLFATRIGVFSYWANSYWGGCVPTIGGALMFGAIPRLLEKATWWRTLIFVGGIFILVNSRLWEGSVMSALGAGYALSRYWMLNKEAAADWAAQVLKPSVVFGLVGLSAMTYYNWRITGRPFVPPHLENRSRNQAYGNFFWESTRLDKHYDHEVIRKYYQESEAYRDQEGYLRIQLEKPKRFWFFLVGPALTIALLGLWGIWRNTRLRLVWLSIPAFFAAHCIVPWHLLPHYAGPIVAPTYLLLIEGLRRLYPWRRKRRLEGAHLARAALCTVAAMLVLRAAAPSLGANVEREFTLPWYSLGLQTNTYRQRIESELARRGGQHLVLVQYHPNHVTHQEWVYNGADIDNSQVIWARHIADKSKLLQLLNYYKNRKIWIVFPDQNPSQLFPYQEIPND